MTTTGHLAMFHTVTAVVPSPTRSPTHWAMPPEISTMSMMSTTMRTSISVTRRFIG